ncbi:hypothetical protein CSA08_01485 [Candidatus Gracilibacteria bacterium]|nr:MAG: hypothetical protein CSA08_01485 [Candidatus Gracilibacteria bacterium]
MNKNIKSGFTLIELLVVITIIGILATGGISVFTAQIEKARDSTRITDLKVLQGGVEQVYQDNSSYPAANEFLSGSAGNTDITDYLEDIPGDPKTGEECNDGGGGTSINCGYSYRAQDATSGVTMGAFELSTAFENSSNVTKKAKNTVDGGNSDVTMELGIDKDTIISAFSGSLSAAAKKGTCTHSNSNPSNATEAIFINGKPSSGICN